MKSLIVCASIIFVVAGCEIDRPECLPVDGACPAECGAPIWACEYGCNSSGWVVAACGNATASVADEVVCARRTSDGKYFLFGSSYPFSGSSYTRFAHCSSEEELSLNSCEPDAGTDAN